MVKKKAMVKYKKDGFTNDNRETAWKAAQAILGAFPWIDSAEGYKYWEDVYRRLYIIAESRKSGRCRVEVPHGY